MVVVTRSNFFQKWLAKSQTKYDHTAGISYCTFLLARVGILPKSILGVTVVRRLVSMGGAAPVYHALETATHLKFCAKSSQPSA